MDQAIQEWTKYNLWKTAFKKFEVIQADHIISNWSIPEYLNPYELQNAHMAPKKILSGESSFRTKTSVNLELLEYRHENTY